MEKTPGTDNPENRRSYSGPSPAGAGGRFVYNIEVSGHCNLRCPACPTGNSPEARHPRGNMAPELFADILEKIRRESTGSPPALCLYNWGEPFLHPDLPQLIALARGAGLPPQLSTNLISDRHLEDVIRARPDSIRISLSGTRPESYRLTHAPGEISRVMSNARRLRRGMDELGIQIPVQFFYHRYRHNQGEDLLGAQAAARELGFGFESIWATFGPLEKVLAYYRGEGSAADQVLADRLCYSLEDARTVSLAARTQFPDCELRARQTTIDFDGSVALCCAVYDREYYLPVPFLECAHQDLQKLKYQHPLCADCMRQGLDITLLQGLTGLLDKVAVRQAD